MTRQGSRSRAQLQQVSSRPMAADRPFPLQIGWRRADPNEALLSLLERCDTPSTRSFVRSVTQGETLGVSIGKILRDLAVDMRKRRRQMAEEKAQKAPIKLLFPLVIFILPAMFVVLLGPALYDTAKQLGGG